MFKARVVSVLGFVVWLSAGLHAQPDSHTTSDPAQALYTHSTWAHGYIHGYEMGFHHGTLDYHMGHNTPRDPRKVKQARESKDWYHEEFGSRESFDHGFKEGFRVGYLDGFAGRDFRATNEVRRLCRRTTAPSDKRDFDHLFADGYGVGQKYGLTDGRRNDAYLPERCSCPPIFAGDADRCDAYRMGFHLGYSDGYSNQRQPGTVRAAKDGN